MSKYKSMFGWLMRDSSQSRHTSERRWQSCKWKGFEHLETRLLLHGDDFTDYEDQPSDDAHQGLVADFSLTDVNPTSATYGKPISPRDYRDQVSVWMFGWST